MNDDASSIVLFLADEAQTRQLGEDLVLALKPGDCLALYGDLGAGKSTLARALIRAIADDEALDVPSPTFTLVQAYDLRLRVSHFDLYRLADASELDELGLSDALDNGVAIVEWPERAEAALPGARIDLRFGFSAEGRSVSISAPPGKLDRIRRVLEIRHFLDEAGLPDSKRRFLVGDASTRAYERIHHPSQPSLVLMDAPRQPDGPVIRDGKPYSQIVHLAEDVYPFVAVDMLLRDRGLAAPRIHAADCPRGILLLEDFGNGTVLNDDGTPNADRYQASVECLAQMHGQSFERSVTLADGYVHHVPDYDRTAMKMEAELLLDWHLPWKRGGVAPSDEERAEYAAIWDQLIDDLSDAENTLVLRDFHSPNIVWRPDESGTDRIGLLDFQDAMFGPSAYDLVSIVQDARVTVEQPLVDRLMDSYLAARRQDTGFDEERFLKAWHIMSAQRACKLNGLWVRLLQRDKKPNYMKHMPRTLWHLSVAFRHPALAPLQAWCARVGIEPSESAG